MRLISYIRNPIDHAESGDIESFKIQALGPLKAAYKGRAMLYSYTQVADEQAVNCRLELSPMSPSEWSIDQSGLVNLQIGSQTRFPCSGLLTPPLEGYIVAPAVKLEPDAGQTVIMMILSPRTSPHSLAVEKSLLKIPDEESTLTMTTSADELHCVGNISGLTESAKIVLDRNPGPPYKAGFGEILTSNRGRGPISAVWKPIAGSFEELVLAFYPSSMDTYTDNSLDFNRIAQLLDAFQPFDTGKLSNYVVGDGPGVTYTLRLEVDRGLGRHASDETRLTVA